MVSGRFIASLNITSLFERYKRLASYVVVGGLSACVDLSLFFAAVYLLDVHYLVAGMVGFVIATLVNYLLCQHYIFRNPGRFGPRGRVFGVYVVSGIGLLLHQVILYALVDVAAIHVVISKLAASALVFFWNYSGRAYFVFK